MTSISRICDALGLDYYIDLFNHRMIFKKSQHIHLINSLDTPSDFAEATLRLFGIDTTLSISIPEVRHLGLDNLYSKLRAHFYEEY